ncbi:MAG: hypothetical protein IJG81_07695 [Muribaculaceae bacterium]|nr:hypothetical protein [Muribaculaceae bacterium]
MRNFDLQEKISLLEKAIKEYNDASFFHDQKKMDDKRNEVLCILFDLPDEFLYLESKKTFYNHARLEDDLPDLIEELKARLASHK